MVCQNRMCDLTAKEYFFKLAICIYQSFINAYFEQHKLQFFVIMNIDKCRLSLGPIEISLLCHPMLKPLWLEIAQNFLQYVCSKVVERNGKEMKRNTRWVERQNIDPHFHRKGKIIWQGDYVKCNLLVFL